MLHASLDEKKGVRLLGAVQFAYTHATKDLIDMTPKYLNTGRRTLFHAKDSEHRLYQVVQTVLLRNAHFIPDNSPKYLNTGRRTLFPANDSEHKLYQVVQTILLRNAHFIRDNSGLVLAKILRLHY